MANSKRSDLLANAGVGNGPDVRWTGGKGVFMVESTAFGGGAVKLQIKSPNNTYIDVPGATLSANGTIGIEQPAGILRAVSTLATAVFAWAFTTSEAR
jgi:hypothetical protein